MKKYSFSIIVTQDKDGTYMARVPELMGCHTQAKTLPTLYKRIQEAISLCVTVQKQKKRAIELERFVTVQQLEVTV